MSGRISGASLSSWENALRFWLQLTHLKLLEADQEERPRKHLPKG